jgi:hypothetical protein
MVNGDVSVPAPQAEVSSSTLTLALLGTASIHKNSLDRCLIRSMQKPAGMCLQVGTGSCNWKMPDLSFPWMTRVCSERVKGEEGLLNLRLTGVAVVLMTVTLACCMPLPCNMSPMATCKQA